MTRSAPSCSFLINIALGIIPAVVLAVAPVAVYAQRGAAGGMRSGGSGHQLSVPRATVRASSGARQSGSLQSGRNTASARTTVGASSHNLASVASAGSPSPRSTLSSSVSVLSSSGMPAGLAMFAEPARVGRGPATSSSAPNPTNRNDTIGFPPSVAGGWAPTPVRGGVMSFSGQGPETWQDSQRGMMSVVPNRSGPAGSILFGGPTSPLIFPPRWFHPRFPIFGPGFGFFGLFSRFGGGCGFFGGCGLVGFGNLGCDPFSGWDCSAYGLDMPIYYSANGVQSGTQDDTSREYGPFAWQNPPASPDSTGPSKSQSGMPGAAPDTLIFLMDGTSYTVTDYWLAGYKLHYITSYGGQNSIDVNELDFQRTVDDNASRGVDFTLRPAPASESAAPQH